MAFKFDQIKGLFASLKEKGTELAGVAADKSKDAARLAKLTVDLNTEKGNLEKAYLELGKAFYEESRDSAQGLAAQLCAEIAAVNDRIGNMESEIEGLKNAFKSAEGPAFEDVVDAAEPDITVEVTEEACCCEGEKKEDDACCCEDEKKEDGECCCEGEKKEADGCCEEPKKTVKEVVENAVEKVEEVVEAIKDAID